VRFLSFSDGEQFPSPDADMEAFRDQMKGKWNDLLKTFHMIDQDKNGTLDVRPDHSQSALGPKYPFSLWYLVVKSRWCMIPSRQFKEFQRGCKLMGLGMSNFQVHRLFTAVAGSENCIYYEQFLDKFQPPQVSKPRVTLNAAAL
jgi:hypothetical protein